MVKAYADQIIARPRRKDIDDVPVRLRDKVIEELHSRGYNEHGDPLTSNTGIED